MPIQAANDPDSFQDFEHTGWSVASETYENVTGLVTAQSTCNTLDAAGVTAGCKMLDVCTGHGGLARAATERGAHASAVDFVDEMVNVARRNAPMADCRRGDAQELSYATNTFDAVVCGFGIIHLPEPGRALSEMLRVLRPGGRVAVSVWAQPASTNGFGLLLGAIKAHGRLDVGLPHGPDVFQFSTPELMMRALAEIGFTDLEATTVSQISHLERTSDFVEAVMHGSVRTKALLLAQDKEALDHIKAAVEQGIGKLFRRGNGFQIPMPAIIGSGTKPLTAGD